jgi:hypothetical protein
MMQIGEVVAGSLLRLNGGFEGSPPSVGFCKSEVPVSTILFVDDHHVLRK